MKPFLTSTLQLLRKLIMVVGFSFFILFTYKATNDVSNQGLASGSPFTKKPAVASLSALAVPRTAYTHQDLSSSINSQDMEQGREDESKPGTAGKPQHPGGQLRSEKIESHYLSDAKTMQSLDKKSLPRK